MLLKPDKDGNIIGNVAGAVMGANPEAMADAAKNGAFAGCTIDENGNIILCDETHTPDSSRYWIAATYEARIAAGQEPENIDKEFLRLWFRERCDPRRRLRGGRPRPGVERELHAA